MAELRRARNDAIPMRKPPQVAQDRKVCSRIRYIESDLDFAPSPRGGIGAAECDPGRRRGCGASSLRQQRDGRYDR